MKSHSLTQAVSMPERGNPIPYLCRNVAINPIFMPKRDNPIRVSYVGTWQSDLIHTPQSQWFINDIKSRLARHSGPHSTVAAAPERHQVPQEQHFRNSELSIIFYDFKSRHARHNGHPSVVAAPPTR
uniref:Uncharacterized protein n=1 Tax=Solanum demissum TaxID=50514 RepID=Q6L471_SOLDE|nr:hypothetical protein SDM1_22t00004 [Solanum demissum]